MQVSFMVSVNKDLLIEEQQKSNGLQILIWIVFIRIFITHFFFFFFASYIQFGLLIKISLKKKLIFYNWMVQITLCESSHIAKWGYFNLY